MEFFTEGARRYGVRSSDFTILLVIKRRSFIELLRLFKEDKEKFDYIREQMLINRDFNFIGEGCVSCGSSEHFLDECDLLHLVLKKRIVVERENVGKQLLRDSDFERNKLREKLSFRNFHLDQKEIV